MKYIFGAIVILAGSCASQKTDEVENKIVGDIISDTSMVVDEVEPKDSLTLMIENVESLVSSIEMRASSGNAMESELENDNFTDCSTDRGCSLKWTVHNEDILTLTSWYGFSNGFQEITYYLDSGKLIFVHEERLTWPYREEEGVFDYDNPEKNFDGKYYFKSEELFHMTTTGHNRFENDEIDPEAILLEEKIEYIQIINNSK